MALPETSSSSARPGLTRPQETWLAIAVLSPFYLNDIFFIFASSFEEWLLADYLSRVATLAGIAAVPAFRRHVRDAFPPLHRCFGNWRRAALALTVFPYGCVLLNDAVHGLINPLFPEEPLFAYPRLGSPGLILLDLTFGMALVALSEELLARAVLKGVLERWTDNRFLITLLSSLLFAAGHWSSGPAAVLGALAMGMVFMAFFLWTRTLLPTLLGHVAADIAYFFRWYDPTT